MKKELFDDLIKSMHYMVAVENGEITPSPAQVHQHRLPDVKLLRTSSGMKQEEFAEIVGVSKGLVQSWEQHRRIPSGAALKLLMMIERNPKIIEELRVL
ncbi:NadS family protein [Yersinia alsatica]|uniref:NadS family protein n=1 Tax=Yersinia alsatica TaxID=2890317 RepID=UPI000B64A085|nr:NadS family protein [Yersinia alsatica]OWF81851.1 transcriptional regulator [Yersinia frederiksenii]